MILSGYRTLDPDCLLYRILILLIRPFLQNSLTQSVQLGVGLICKKKIHKFVGIITAFYIIQADEFYLISGQNSHAYHTFSLDRPWHFCKKIQRVFCYIFDFFIFLVSNLIFQRRLENSSIISVLINP